MPLALFALTLSAFAIGTTEFVIVGLIPTIAEQLNVSLPSAGLLVSLYALGVAIGAPVLTALTGKVPRKWLLVGLMALFTAGNLLAWQAPGYESLIVARILTGLAHGVFFSVGSTIATGLVAKEKAASAIAIMFSGLTVALVTGVPLGTWIGQVFGWRETFLVVSLLGLVAMVGSLLLIPSNLPKGAASTIREQLSVLTKKPLLLVYAKTALGYGGAFTAFTFLAPILQQVSGFSAGAVSLTTGGPAETYLPDGFNGDIDGVLRPIQRGILQFVGFDVLRPHIFYAQVRVSQEEREAWLAQWAERLGQIEQESPIGVGRYQ
jgi:DHA1 family inner membrane transport protein